LKINNNENPFFGNHKVTGDVFIFMVSHPYQGGVRGGFGKEFYQYPTTPPLGKGRNSN
jgi:hypothetical protein